MKKGWILFFMIGFLFVNAQEGTRNWGMLKIHDQGSLGFHSNLINDGVFDDNQGLAGFYNDGSLSLSGLFPPVFQDVELLADNGLELQVSMALTNNMNFILGDVGTRSDPFVSLQFLSDTFHTGSQNLSKVDGLASVSNKQNFIFPVGDAEQLRPLIINSEGVNSTAQCIYFFGNANDAGFLTSVFDNTILENISDQEFWQLEGSVPSTIQISWNNRSQLSLITDQVEAVTIVGWSKAQNQWVNLGDSAVGDLNQGFAASASFVPNDYEVLTFGSLHLPEIFPDLGNHLLTPNGDGVNDFLHFEELAQSLNNRVLIFDRNGLLVFEKKNYTNEFNGFANTGDLVISRSSGLPSGVYFYLVDMDDLKLEYQGYLYLARD
ncbi:gliding motility-associated C-terminal domain-containing protein [Allomuricauda sp. M10]|uniref:gliding motility-associated C-terminal domain-containing protein n=1 Tax=Allomuricauda sp. M10 TaxID=2683292 RepID=UPI001D186500|nr:gliding motility-associated C-terminal domain-containing protein [Muricauda sp. M10]